MFHGLIFAPLNYKIPLAMEINSQSSEIKPHQGKRANSTFISIFRPRRVPLFRAVRHRFSFFAYSRGKTSQNPCTICLIGIHDFRAKTRERERERESFSFLWPMSRGIPPAEKQISRVSLALSRPPISQPHRFPIQFQFTGSARSLPILGVFSPERREHFPEKSNRVAGRRKMAPAASRETLSRSREMQRSLRRILEEFRSPPIGGRWSSTSKCADIQRISGQSLRNPLSLPRLGQLVR